MKKLLVISLLAGLLLALAVTGCQDKQTPAPAGTKTIAVTYSALASLVKELAGDYFTVTSIIPNGLDLHEWEPSAKDVETMMKASLIVQNGLGLEGGLEKTLARASESGVKMFTVSDYVTIRRVGAGEGIPTDDPDQQLGAEDPHLWLDPLAMKTALNALADYIKREFSVDVSQKAAELSGKLDALDASTRAMVAAIPAGNRKLVTGHESLGYFAKAYGFKLVGAIIPSLTTAAQVSASDMANLKKMIAENHVRVIFTEAGTPQKVEEALARDAHVKSVTLVTHSLPADGSYFTLITDLARTISESLK